MNFIIILFSTFSVAVLNAFCSMITVSCKAKSKFQLSIFKLFMQDILDHSTEIWQCYKDYLKVDRPGYEVCIDSINMREDCIKNVRIFPKSAFRSRENWKRSLNSVAVQICENIHALESESEFVSSSEVSVTGGDFENVAYTPDPWSTESTMMIIILIALICLVIGSIIYSNNRKSVGKKEVIERYVVIDPSSLQNRILVSPQVLPQYQYPNPTQYISQY